MHILLTGGSGFVGQCVTKYLIQKGHQISWLSRSKQNKEGIKSFVWDIANNYIDPKCFDGVDVVIHLAGAGVMDQRWSFKRKTVLRDSRVKSAALLLKNINEIPNKIQHLISISATGYYGDRASQMLDEESAKGDDFLADLCEEWEHVILENDQTTYAKTILRIPIVFGLNGGALPKLTASYKFGIGVYFGPDLIESKQYMPWVHMHDLARIFEFIIEHKNEGIFNAVAGSIRAKKLMQEIGKSYKKKPFIVSVPASIVKMIFGESSITLLNSTNVDNRKIQSAGFQFEFDNIGKALNHLLQ